MESKGSLFMRVSLFCSEPLRRPLFKVETVFASRCEKAANNVEKLRGAGIATLAKVALVPSYAPGASTDDALIRALDDAPGSQSNLGQKSSWRRLFHEAYV